MLRLHRNRPALIDPATGRILVLYPATPHGWSRALRGRKLSGRKLIPTDQSHVTAHNGHGFLKRFPWQS